MKTAARNLAGRGATPADAIGSPAAALQFLAAVGVEPRGVADDSRQVREGDVFLAYPGDLADGRAHVADAVARGAVAVLWQEGGAFAWNARWEIANRPCVDLRAWSGPFAHAVCGYPSERLSLVAVTGTNGKTSVSHWIARCHPRRCAIIGTLGAGLPGQLADTGFTTPEAAALARYLAEFAAGAAGFAECADAGAQACALEASSIGIEEGRLNGARVDVAVFTNLTRDHLDYHGTMDGYAAAKEKLFNWPRLRLAVVNLDDPFGVELAARSAAAKVVGYTLGDAPNGRQGAIRAEELAETPFGTRFTLSAPNGRARVETALVGRFNVSNLLAVAAVLIDAGLTPKEVAARFADLAAPPGRMESLGGNGDPLLVVDYAHTPDALENALAALRPVASARRGRLAVVFGCGGDRDRGKRPQMGEVAARLADHVVLTSDNPRGEDADAIIGDIRRGASGAEIIADRAAAIRRTIAAAHPSDVVLIAGKGHEPYQETAGVRTPFSDLAEARAALLLRQERFK